LRVGDLVAMAAIWIGTLVMSNITTVENRDGLQSWLLVGAVVLSTGIALQRADLYSEPTTPRTDEIAGLTRSTIIGSGLMAVVAAFADFQLGAWEIVIGSGLALTALLLGRGVHRSLKAEIRKDSRARVVIVGVGAEAYEVAELIQDHPESSLELVGVIGDLTVAQKHGLASAWLGPVDRTSELMQRHSAAAAVVTPTGFRSEQFERITRTLFSDGYDVYLSTGITRTHAGSYGIRSIAHEPLVVLTRHTAPTWTYGIKRAMDIVGASIALILAAPVILVTALVIKIEDRGPVFFHQKRAGLDAKMFNMIKFRSMVVDAEAQKAELKDENQRTGPLFKLSRDPRITRVGRLIRDLSIDELPQLINVLKGDMSLVGPRPALPEEEQAFEGELRARFDIRPGISGLWQVEARSNASFAAYHRLDLHYLENWSLRLDIRILMATVAQVLENVFLLPLKLLTRGGSVDTISDTDPRVVLDIRDPKPELRDLGPKTPSAVGTTSQTSHPQ
jgi:exopolysaccharide biosynthesis polyprenyl glycosylphosphotransferase